MLKYPQRIVCLTEESVETLYLLGAQHQIAGISTYVCRPPQAKKNHPVVSAFTHANIQKIIDLKPDLVLGHSDIQKDIARELIGRGLDVWIANHRALDSILDYVLRLGGIVGKSPEAQILVQALAKKIEFTLREMQQVQLKPLVYIEEWDEPMITAIKWFSQLVELCGAKVLFKQQSQEGTLAQARVVEWVDVCRQNPDIMLACWCGKALDRQSVISRSGAGGVKAIAEEWLLELDPAIFLQPGPAPILAGIDILSAIFQRWREAQTA